MCSKTNNSSKHEQEDHFENKTEDLEAPLLVEPEEAQRLDPYPAQSKPDPLIEKGPTDLSLSIKEAKAILKISLPMVLSGLLLYSRSLISLVFLGRLGHLSLASGSLAVGFANITGYAVLSSLAMGMEPICGQAFGAGRHSLLGLALKRMVALLLLTALPIAALWANMERILVLCGQDQALAHQAHIFLLFSLPDLLAQALLHPLRIFLRAQGITLPLTYCAAVATLLHAPINYLLVTVLGLGMRGVAVGSVWTNFNLVILLLLYVWCSGGPKDKPVMTSHSDESWFSLQGFKSLFSLALPSCVSVCLEWWWYDIMILLCGLLTSPTATVASMGILIQTTSLIYIFPSSLSVGVSTRVGNLLGASWPEKAKRSATVGLVMGFVVGVAALHFAVGVRQGWARMFTGEADIIALTSAVLPIIGLCELGNCPQTTGCGVLRGTARPKVGANINLGCFYCVGMPVAVWLAFFRSWDFTGLWVGLLAAQASCVATMLWVVVNTDWAAEARRAQHLTTGSAPPPSTSRAPTTLLRIKTGSSKFVSNVEIIN